MLNKSLIFTIILLLLGFSAWSQESDLTHYIYGEENLELLIQKKLNIIGIEYVLAEDSNAELATSFGHSFLRFVDDDEDWSNDITVSFSVGLPNEELDAQGAFTGKYKLSMTFSHLGEMWREYSNENGRMLSRYIILTDNVQRASVIKTLEEWSLEPEEKLGRYSFLNNNCASTIFRVLSEAKIAYSQNTPKSPNSLPYILKSEGLSPYPPLELLSFTKAQKRAEKIGVSFEMLAKETNEQNIINKILESKDELLIKQLLVLNRIQPRMDKRLAEHYKFNQGNYSYDQVIGHEYLPKELYTYCEDSLCAEQVLNVAERLWDVTGWFSLNALFSNGIQKKSDDRLNESPSLNRFKRHYQFIRDSY